MANSFNYLAILVSAVASLLANFIWYMFIFKAAYIQALGKTQAQMAKGPKLVPSLGIQLVGNAVMALMLAWLIKTLGYTSISEGMKLAVMLWLGFVAAVMGPMYAFEANSFRLFLINSGAVLLTFLITAAIVSGLG